MGLRTQARLLMLFWQNHLLSLWSSCYCAGLPLRNDDVAGGLGPWAFWATPRVYRSYPHPHPRPCAYEGILSGQFSGFPEIFRNSGLLCFSTSLTERMRNVGEAEAALGGRVFQNNFVCFKELGIGCGSGLQPHASGVLG